MERYRRFRILELIRRAEGGMKKHYISLVKGLKIRGLEVVALCNFGEGDMEDLRETGIDLIPFPLEGELNPAKDLAAIAKVVDIIRNKDIDVVHCHGFKAGFIGRIAGWITGRPCLYTVHNFLPSSAGRIKKNVAIGLEKILAKKTHAIITVSRALQSYERKMLNIPENKIKVIYNGIDLPKLQEKQLDIRKEWGISSNDILVGTVARLIPSKGIDFLIRAVPKVLEKHSNVKFMIVGDGPEDGKLKKLAKEINCENYIIFTGYIEYVWYCYRAFDIFVLPSLSEGLGIAVLEAMVSGKPVIASNTGGIPEIIEHGVNGYLVEPGDSWQIAEAILKLLSSPEERKRYGEAGYQTVVEKFDNNIMVDKTFDIIVESIQSSKVKNKKP